MLKNNLMLLRKNLVRIRIRKRFNILFYYFLICDRINIFFSLCYKYNI